MLSACLAAVALSQGAAQPSPGAIVSRMLARYHAAKTLSGTVVLTQSAQGKSVQVKTGVDFDREASRISVRQTSPSQEKPMFVVSDGQIFNYSIPLGMLLTTDESLFEPVEQPTGKFDVARIYVTAIESFQDRSPVLDVATSDNNRLKFLRGQWANVVYQGNATINDKPVQLIGGDWRQYETAPASGQYQMAITEEGDLMRYVLKETVAVDPSVPPVEVTSTWEADLKLDVPVDGSKFVVVRK